MEQLALKTMNNKAWTSNDKVFLSKNMKTSNEVLSKRLCRTVTAVQIAKSRIKTGRWVIEEEIITTDQEFNSNDKTTNVSRNIENYKTLMSFDKTDDVTSELDDLKKDIRKIIKKNMDNHKEVLEVTETLRNRVNLLNTNINQIKSDISLLDRWCNKMMTNQHEILEGIKRNRSVRLKLWDWMKGFFIKEVDNNLTDEQW